VSRKLKLVGEKFGRLLVIEEDISINQRAVWKCLCDCGNTLPIRGSSLTYGSTQSCGCLQKERTSCAHKKEPSELIGKVFSELTVTSYIKSPKGFGRYDIICLCSCGKTTDPFPIKKLLQKKSCGCLMHGERQWNYNPDREALKLKWKLRSNMTQSINRCLFKKKRITSSKILGYTHDDLKNHLTSKFTSEMNWKNYGTYWNIDHIIPINWFLNNNITDPRIINSLDNLNALTINENCKKHTLVDVEMLEKLSKKLNFTYVKNN
jgi:hypothetical protein